MADAGSARRYAAPPIVEAVVQVQYVEPATDADFRKLTRRLVKGYSNSVELATVNAQLNFQDQEAKFLASPQTRFSSDDQADVLVAAPNMLTWSRLAPYEGWDQLYQRVKQELDLANSVFGYKKVARLGVRYVNRLDIPSAIGDIVRYEDYLTINLTVRESWIAIDNYAWRLEKHFGDLTAIVQSVITEPVVPEMASFILDIDVVTRDAVPPKPVDVYAKMLEMRDLKNRIFEVSVTDTARASFNR